MIYENSNMNFMALQFQKVPHSLDAEDTYCTALDYTISMVLLKFSIPMLKSIKKLVETCIKLYLMKYTFVPFLETVYRVLLIDEKGYRCEK
jgi:antibiotic biosynthesis monooxygenase (ABM) superfamily enzyme